MRQHADASLPTWLGSRGIPKLSGQAIVLLFAEHGDLELIFWTTTLAMRGSNDG